MGGGYGGVLGGMGRGQLPSIWPFLLILPLTKTQRAKVQRAFAGNSEVEKNKAVRTKQSSSFLLHRLSERHEWFLPSPEPRMVQPTIQPAYPE